MATKQPKAKAKASTEVAATFVVDPAGVIAPFSREEALDVINRAREGDEAAVPRLLELLRVDRPRAIRGCGGDLPDMVRTAMVKRYAGKDNLAAEYGVYAKLNDLRAELSGPDPSALERLLVDQVLVGWMETYTLDFQSHRSMTFTQEAHMARLRSRAQSRYLRSIKALASVRKLPASTLIQVAVGTVDARTGGEPVSLDRPAANPSALDIG